MNLWLWAVFWAERAHWFSLWLSEGLYGRRDKFWPWAEANQGLLSVTALVTALILFLIEQQRAIAAEARAIEADRKADLRFREENAEADRRLKASMDDADRRSREQAEEADRKALAASRAADRKAAVAEQRVRNNSVREYVDAVIGLVDKIIADAASDLEACRKLTANSSGNASMPAAVQISGYEVEEALKALLPAVPRSPALILLTQRLIGDCWAPRNAETYGALESNISRREGVIETFSKHRKKLEQLRPEE